VGLKTVRSPTEELCLGLVGLRVDPARVSLIF